MCVNVTLWFVGSKHEEVVCSPWWTEAWSDQIKSWVLIHKDTVWEPREEKKKVTSLLSHAPVTLWNGPDWGVGKPTAFPARGLRSGWLVLVVQSCWPLATPWIAACQASLFLGFSRQEHWSGLPFPSPGGLPDPGIEPVSPALQADYVLLSHQGSLPTVR